MSCFEIIPLVPDTAFPAISKQLLIVPEDPEILNAKRAI